MRGFYHTWGRVFLALVVAAGMTDIGLGRSRAQEGPEALIVRTPPPSLDDLETDANHDGLPDGWYNAQGAKLMPEGGPVGPQFVRFECSRPGRLTTLSRAFGIDGKKAEAIELGLWVRQSNVQVGERDGSEPALFIDFLGADPHGAAGKALGRGSLGPWTQSIKGTWTRVVKRIPIPSGTKDAIMSIGLMGSTGMLDIDGLTFKLIEVGPTTSANLIVNGDFELGDPAPYCWAVERDAKRVFPGFNSSAAAELRAGNSRLMAGLATEVAGLQGLDISIAVRANGLRGAGGAGATVFFLDDTGRPVQGREFLLTWSDSFDWRVDRAFVRVPAGARRAVFQIQKNDSIGAIRFDDVRITASPNPEEGEWSPFDVSEDTRDWLEMPPSREIKAESALDVSFLLRAPAGEKGPVTVKDGHLTFGGKERARFFGVCLLPPAAFQPAELAERLADRLARSGVNLVRLGDLDAAYGPDRSLFDDARDDTKEFDPKAVERLDHLIAELKKRGIYVAVELQSKRRFRVDDGVSLHGLLPSGGGPAAIFDSRMGQLALKSATALLGHKNLETELALKEDPALAWVTLAGETSLFDLLDNPRAMPEPYAKKLAELERRTQAAAGHRFWESLESGQFKKMAEALRKDDLKAPIASVSHWRREGEFCAALAGTGLDLIDDRIYWPPLPWASPEIRSMIWASPARGLDSIAGIKRRADRPYVLGQWCNQTTPAWSFPDEAADYLLGVYMAVNSDWDGVVRRGVFLYPQVWGEGPAGTVGGEDLYQIPEALNGSPHVYALLPHAASLFLRGRGESGETKGRAAEAVGKGTGKGRRRSGSEWDPARGRLYFETPFTQGVAGWFRGETASFPQVELATENPFAVLVATSLSNEPIASTKRLLVSAIARVQPTDFRWVNGWKREVANPGRPPFLQEPVTATVKWKRKGDVRCYVLNNEGERVAPVTLEGLPHGEGVMLSIDGKTAAFHWEFTVE